MRKTEYARTVEPDLSAFAGGFRLNFHKLWQNLFPTDPPRLSTMRNLVGIFFSRFENEIQQAGA
jgi:hypothetical protein